MCLNLSYMCAVYQSLLKGNKYETCAIYIAVSLMNEYCKPESYQCMTKIFQLIFKNKVKLLHQLVENGINLDPISSIIV